MSDASIEERIAEILDAAIVSQVKQNDGWWNRYESYADGDDACEGPTRKLLKLDGSLDPAAVAAVLVRELGLQQVMFLLRSWRAVPDYDVTPVADPRQPTDMDVAYDDAAMQILRALGLEP